MNAYTANLPARKSSKNSKIEFTAALDNDFSPVAGFLKIDTDRDSFCYAVEEFPTGDDARGFVFHKIGNLGSDPKCSFYHLYCHPGLPEITGCSCDGKKYHGHCKHADAVNSLIESGKL